MYIAIRLCRACGQLQPGWLLLCFIRPIYKFPFTEWHFLLFVGKQSAAILDTCKPTEVILKFVTHVDRMLGELDVGLDRKAIVGEVLVGVFEYMSEGREICSVGTFSDELIRLLFLC